MTDTYTPGLSSSSGSCYRWKWYLVEVDHAIQKLGACHSLLVLLSIISTLLSRVSLPFVMAGAPCSYTIDNHERDYDKWEHGLNKVIAKTLLAELQPRYLMAKVAARSRPKPFLCCPLSPDYGISPVSGYFHLDCSNECLWNKYFFVLVQGKKGASSRDQHFHARYSTEGSIFLWLRFGSKIMFGSRLWCGLCDISSY